MLVAGGTESAIAIPAGFDMDFLGGEPYGASCTFAGIQDSSWNRGFMEAAEAASYPRDMFAYIRIGIGSLLSDRFFFGGGPADVAGGNR